MTKTHTIKTIEEYDKDGKLTRKTTTETTEESNYSLTDYGNQGWSPYRPQYPNYADKTIWHDNGPDVSTTTTAQNVDTSATLKG